MNEFTRKKGYLVEGSNIVLMEHSAFSEKEIKKIAEESKKEMAKKDIKYALNEIVEEIDATIASVANSKKTSIRAEETTCSLSS